MRLSTSDIIALKTRIVKTNGKLRAACRLANITDRVIYKLLAGGNIRQQTYDKFMDGLERLESYEKEKRQANSRRIRGKLLSPPVTDSTQADIQPAVVPETSFRVIRKDDPTKPKKKKSIFLDKKLAGDLMMARHWSDREKVVEQIRQKKMQAFTDSRK